MTTQQNEQETIRPFLCDDGFEHLIGQNYDERHGCGNGPQVCLKCHKTLNGLIRQREQALLDEVEERLVGSHDEIRIGNKMTRRQIDWSDEIMGTIQAIRKERKL